MAGQDFSDASLGRIKGLISLGDNCEFGFVQRRLGLEPSGLIRWAIAKPSDVLSLLRDIHAGKSLEAIYAYEGIEPHSPKMVRDARTNFCFHTTIAIDQMSGSKQLSFAEDTFKRLATWKVERDKFQYLANSFATRLSAGANIYVIKHIKGSTGECHEIAALLQSFHPDNRLLMVSEAGGEAGRVTGTSGPVISGVIGRFAPYSAADDCDYESWNALLADLLEQI